MKNLILVYIIYISLDSLWYDPSQMLNHDQSCIYSSTKVLNYPAENEFFIIKNELQ
jgi:hypothetical protein